MMTALLALVCSGSLMTSCDKKGNEQAESLFEFTDSTEDRSQFVVLTDVIPDAILEIRYFGTYNFVQKRLPTR